MKEVDCHERGALSANAPPPALRVKLRNIVKDPTANKEFPMSKWGNVWRDLVPYEPTTTLKTSWSRAKYAKAQRNRNDFASSRPLREVDSVVSPRQD